MHARPLSLLQYLIPESCTQDEIYATHVPAGKSISSVRKENEMYKTNDYTLSAFSTMGKGLKLVHRNNIATAIRTYEEVRHLAKRMNNDNSHRGVMLVEKFTLNIYSKVELYDILKGYMDDPDILFSVSDLDKYLEEYDDLRVSSSYRLPVTIRYGSFVPEKQIVDNGSLYIKEYDIVVTSNDYKHLPKHPYSKSSNRMSHIERVAALPSNIVTIDITDNSVPKEHSELGTSIGYVSKSYFINIGGNVHKLLATADGCEPDGCSIAVKTQFSENPSVITVNNLEDLPSIGIYKTHEEAQYSGDTKLKLEEMKVNNEAIKLQNELTRLKHDMDRLEEENNLANENIKLLSTKYENEKMRLAYETSKLEVEKLKLEYEAKMYKRKMVSDFVMTVYKLTGQRLEQSKFERERVQSNERHERDMEMSKIKHDRDMEMVETKFVYDTVRSEDKAETDMMKTMLDMELTDSKFEHEEEMARMKKEHEKYKHEADILNKVLNTAIPIVKDMF